MTGRLLTFLLDADDLACVERDCPDALHGAVMACDADVHVHLLNRGMTHLTPWDVVERDECGELRRFKSSVFDFWEHCAGGVYDGVDCFRLARFRHISCFTRLSWVAYMIGRTLETVPHDEIVTFEETSGHGLDRPFGDCKMPLLFALVRGMAEQAGTPVRLLRRNLSQTRRQVTGPDVQADGAGHDARILDLSSEFNGRPFVLFTGSGHDLLRQLPVIKELGKSVTLDVVQLYKTADDQVVRVLRNAGHRLWHESQVTGDDVAAPPAQWLADVRRCFDDQRRRVPDPLRCIFANPRLNIHFDFIFGEYLERMVWHVQTWERFFAKCRPAMLVANYAAPIVDVAHHMDIPCLLLPHGSMMLGDAAWYDGLPPALPGAISDLHQQRLTSFGIQKKRIRITGDPGLDRVIEEANSSEPADDSARTELASTIGIDPKRKLVLLVTANSGSPWRTARLPEVDFKDATRCHEALGEVAGRHPEWAFLIKCHPRFDFHPLYQRVNQNLPDERKMALVGDRDLSALVPVVDAVVIANTISSAIFEASLWHKPVIILKQSIIWFDHDLWGIAHWPQADSVDALQAQLERIFGDSVAYQSSVQQSTDALAKCFGSRPQPSAARCARVIEQLVHEKAAEIADLPGYKTASPV